MSNASPKIDSTWLEALSAEFDKDYFKHLRVFLEKEKSNFTVYPPGSKIFAAFDATPFDKVKVVIIGQDPYHGPGQANGLSFSVTQGKRVPPSLKNIFKEMESDLGLKPSKHGDLKNWAENGVLMLNAVLTVRDGQPGSHRNQGWELFTDATIKALSERKENIVFILWGNFARGKKHLIDTSKHHIIESVHPSPFAARNGFFGSRPFSRTNEILKKHNLTPIDWEL